ncbi:GNAT family N-acetyltransferase [Desulfosporosinus sp. BG]|uniref:GNAT family N-acetyltransferase n=1 Tax=Desulfosporosinus sp. BG TaxID=1633135 RepID=UPI000856C297|nr:GNAT family N-acetyltransferase [Desulfosporosinus sp. BG]ODA42408.1 GCN5-related N-acetyltransferase [Desulfosporosinus sp. BG]
MLIREAIETDLPSVIELLKAMDGEDGIDSDEAGAVWCNMMEYPYYKVFVVEDDKRIVGTCSLIIIDNLGHQGAKLAVAESMIVSQDYRGRGMGSKLMQFVMGKAQEENCYKLDAFQ